MTTLLWTPALSVGSPEIDEQHEELFRRAERLIVALREGDRSGVEPLVGYLTDYVISHFEAEERLMVEARYPGLDPHLAEHRACRAAFFEVFADYRRKGATALVSMTLHNWVQAWLRDHVAGMDQELGRWLAGRRS